MPIYLESCWVLRWDFCEVIVSEEGHAKYNVDCSRKQVKQKWEREIQIKIECLRVFKMNWITRNYKQNVPVSVFCDILKVT